jgi:hypothetical protein
VLIGRGVSLLESSDLFRSQTLAELSAECLSQQTPAHADATMNTPHAQRISHLSQCLMPREDVVINAVNKRAVEIE